MNERTLEIIVRSCPEDVFGPGWRLRAQQLSLPSGRIDLLFVDGEESLQLVELKKGRATPASIDQVLAYKHDLENELDGSAITPWVVAHDISIRTERRAAESGVRVLALSLQKCAAIAENRGITERDLLGQRWDGTVISGGGAKRGLRHPVPNEEAYAKMPPTMAGWLRKLEHDTHMDVASGGMQTVLHYRGVKLGGVNRTSRGGVAYIASGVVLAPSHEQALHELGFRRMTKTQRGSSHEHIWWEILSSRVESFARAIDNACALVDRTLGIKCSDGGNGLS